MDWQAIGLTMRLAACTTGLLLIIGLPVAYWLARSTWRWKFFVEAVVALPLILPPTVLVQLPIEGGWNHAALATTSSHLAITLATDFVDH